jgi:hypothetical protein
MSSSSVSKATTTNNQQQQQQHQETLASLSIKLQTLVEQHPQENDETEEKEDPEIIKLSLLYTRLNLNLNRTHVGPSTITGGTAGRGLFASCDCKEGDLLTCYPGDAFVIIPDDSIPSEWTVLWGDHVADPEAYDIIDNNLLGYMVHAYDDYGVVGLPSLAEDPAYLGHFANDGCADVPLCEADLAPYNIESDRLANAMHDDLGESHMVTTATRDISKGEEIFVTYGPEYWMEQPLFGTASPSPAEPENKPRSPGKGFG